MLLEESVQVSQLLLLDVIVQLRDYMCRDGRGLLLLLTFILENSQRVDISFFGAHGHLPLGVALLLAAVLGVLLVVIPGTARIVQLRMVARLHRGIDAKRATRSQRNLLVLPCLVPGLPGRPHWFEQGLAVGGGSSAGRVVSRLSAAEQFSQRNEPVGLEQAVQRRCLRRGSARSPLKRPPDEDRPEAKRGGGMQVWRVRSDHAGLRWPAVEQPKGRAVHPRIGLVAAGQLGREHRVNAEIGELEQVG